ncbi:hypothetical protein FQZ97_902980 [compost metagenome]
MALAGDHGKDLVRCDAHTDLMGLLVLVLAPGAETGSAEIAAPGDRHADHPEHHPAAFHQRHVDSELVAAGDELLGAIQWIDQPPALPTGPLGQRDVRSLLGQHRDTRVQRRQAGGKQLVRREVGGGHG